MERDMNMDIYAAGHAAALALALALAAGCGKESGAPGAGGASSAGAPQELAGEPVSVGGGVETKALWDSGDNALTDSDNEVAVYDFLYGYTEWAEDGTSAAADGPYMYIPRVGEPDENGSYGTYDEEYATTSSMHGTESTWAASGRTYFWTADGTHRFISWLTKEKYTDDDKYAGYAAMDDKGDGDGKLSAAEFFGSGLKFTAPAAADEPATLSIPAVTFTPQTPQFDFVYSDVATRDLNGGADYSSAVPLTYHHLFTAFSMGVVNNSSNTVTIKSLSILDLPDTKSGVTVTFPVGTLDETVSTTNVADIAADLSTDGKSSITDDAGNAHYAYYTFTSNSASLAKGEQVVDIFHPSATEESDDMFQLLWPLGEGELQGSIEKLTNEDGSYSVDESTGRYKTSISGPYIHIEFDVTNSNGEVVSNSKDVLISDTESDSENGWESGKKYRYLLVISDKYVTLDFVALPWDYVEYELDYTKDNVQGTRLVYEETNATKVDTFNQTITYNNEPIKGQFSVRTPMGGRWFVSLSGDTQYFRLQFDESVSNSYFFLSGQTENPATSILSGSINPDWNGGQVNFVIVPLDLDRNTEHRVTLHFMAEVSGRRMAADDALNTNGLNTTEGDKEYKAYTIILPKAS